MAPHRLVRVAMDETGLAVTTAHGESLGWHHVAVPTVALPAGALEDAQGCLAAAGGRAAA